MMRKYEIMFILDDRKIESHGKGFQQKVKEQLQQLGGTVTASTLSNRQQLAYAINRRHSGVFLNLNAQLSPDQVATFQDMYRRDERVLRMQVYLEAPSSPVRNKNKNKPEPVPTAEPALAPEPVVATD